MSTFILALMRLKHDKFARTISLMLTFNVFVGLLAINLNIFSRSLITTNSLFIQLGIKIVCNIILISVYLLTICFLSLRHIYYVNEYLLYEVSGFQTYQLYLSAIWENLIILLAAALGGTLSFIFCVWLMTLFKISIKYNMDFSFYLLFIALVLPSSVVGIMRRKNNKFH